MSNFLCLFFFSPLKIETAQYWWGRSRLGFLHYWRRRYWPLIKWAPLNRINLKEKGPDGCWSLLWGMQSNTQGGPVCSCLFHRLGKAFFFFFPLNAWWNRMACDLIQDNRLLHLDKDFNFWTWARLTKDCYEAVPDLSTVFKLNNMIACSWILGDQEGKLCFVF